MKATIDAEIVVNLKLSKKEAIMLYLLVACMSGNEAHKLTDDIIKRVYKNLLKQNPDLNNLSGLNWTHDIISPIYKNIGSSLNLKTD